MFSSSNYQIRIKQGNEQVKLYKIVTHWRIIKFVLYLPAVYITVKICCAHKLCFNLAWFSYYLIMYSRQFLAKQICGQQHSNLSLVTLRWNYSLDVCFLFLACLPDIGNGLKWRDWLAMSIIIINAALSNWRTRNPCHPPSLWIFFAKTRCPTTELECDCDGFETCRRKVIARSICQTFEFMNNKHQTASAQNYTSLRVLKWFFFF